MTIQTAILGFLNQKPRSGYDLKREFQADLYLHWSGNNNQIYRALMALHREGLVSATLETPERGPAKKIYTITSQGRESLRDQLLEPPELPQVRNSFLGSLAVMDSLSDSELTAQILAYGDQLEIEISLWRERLRRLEAAGPRDAARDRSAAMTEAIYRRWIEYYERERECMVALANELATPDSEERDED